MAFALGQLDKNGAPFLVEGIRSDNAAAQCFSLQMLEANLAKPYFAELWPTLKTMLADDKYVNSLGGIERPIDVRIGAIGLLGGMGPAAKQALPALEKTKFLYSPHATITKEEDEKHFVAARDAAFKAISGKPAPLPDKAPKSGSINTGKAGQQPREREDRAKLAAEKEARRTADEARKEAERLEQEEAKRKAEAEAKKKAEKEAAQKAAKEKAAKEEATAAEKLKIAKETRPTKVLEDRFLVV